MLQPAHAQTFCGGILTVTLSNTNLQAHLDQHDSEFKRTKANNIKKQVDSFSLCMSSQTGYHAEFFIESGLFGSIKAWKRPQFQLTSGCSKMSFLKLPIMVLVFIRIKIAPATVTKLTKRAGNHDCCISNNYLHLNQFRCFLLPERHLCCM